MRRDRISEDEVRACIEEPEETAPGARGRVHYLRRRGDSMLRVTAIAEDGDFVIITVTLRRGRQ